MVRSLIGIVKNPRQILSNPLLWGSFVMLLSSLFSNVAAYLYNLFIGRTLGPVNYGILAAVISLLSVISIPTAALSTSIVKFSSDYKARKDMDGLAFFFRKLSLLFFFAGVLSFLLFFFLQNYLAGFLNIPSTLPIIILGFLFFLNFTQTVNNGVLSGLQNFNFIAFAGLFSSILKLIFGVVLVYFGFSVNGALGAIALSVLSMYLLSFIPLKYLFSHRAAVKRSVPWRSFFLYCAPVFLSTLGLNLLITTDIILVKKFFSPEEAGIYSALSLVGRVIFFASSSMVSVMFSLVAERHSGEREYRHLLYYSLLMAAAVSIPAVIFYYFFPAFSMKFFFGDKYLAASPYLWLFGTFVTVYSLANIMINFFLSIRRVFVALLPFLFSLIQIVAIYFLHRDFVSVITVSLLCAFLLLSALVLYYLKHEAFRDRAGVPAGPDHR
ncbi:MAG: oligosaccharide flippase family protein [Patescibacteria group bacterium]